MNTNAKQMEDLAVRVSAKDAGQKAIVDAFTPVFHEVRRLMDDVITEAVYASYTLTWKRKAWKGYGYKSANAMFAALLNLPEDMPKKDRAAAVKVEVNRSTYIRKNSPIALAKSGRKRGGKASQVTLDSFAAYVERATVAVTLTDQNALNAADSIIAAMLAWRDKHAALLKIAA